MGALKDFLVSHVAPGDSDEASGWAEVVACLGKGDHLEQALAGKSLPANLVAQIVRLTWQYVADSDRHMFLKAVERSEDFPLGRLIGRLFLSSHKVIDVVTTNYDRLIEYACNDAGLLVTTGFRPGYIQAREGSSPLTYSSAGKAIRLVRISKVHGSLDWFQRKDGTVLASPFFELPGYDVTPLIVTPGFNKYERTHDEPFRSAIQGADRALENADGYLCLGFGFRDSHIEPKMLDRCRQKSVPVTVLARTLTDEAKSFLSSKAGTKYLGLEATANGTRAYTNEYPAGIEIDGIDAWSIAGFIKLVT